VRVKDFFLLVLLINSVSLSFNSLVCSLFEGKKMEREEENVVPTDEPEIKHAGVKAIAFIIGKIENERGRALAFLTSTHLFLLVLILNIEKQKKTIAGNEAFEKLGTIGTSSNLILYLNNVFHMKKVTAATLINIFNGTTNMAPLLGAFLSDSYFGRYKTLAFASMSSLLVIWMIFLSFLDRISHVCISILDPRP
jgi:hypothetical protein